MKTVGGIPVISPTIGWVWMAPGCQDSGRGVIKASDGLASRMGYSLPSTNPGCVVPIRQIVCPALLELLRCLCSYFRRSEEK